MNFQIKNLDIIIIIIIFILGIKVHPFLQQAFVVEYLCLEKRCLQLNGCRTQSNTTFLAKSVFVPRGPSPADSRT